MNRACYADRKGYDNRLNREYTPLSCGSADAVEDSDHGYDVIRTESSNWMDRAAPRG